MTTILNVGIADLEDPEQVIRILAMRECKALLDRIDDETDLD